jgi:hypothetical protein
VRQWSINKMVQNTLVIDNQGANAARLDIQEAIRAAATNSSDATASPTSSTPPTTTYANMWWYDTFTHYLKVRNEANNAWLDVAYIHQTNGLEILDGTQLRGASGQVTGLLADQLTSAWQTGTETLDSLVSPAQVKASVIAHATSAVHAIGAVGTYIFGRRAGSTSAQATFSAGTTYPGTSLYPAGISGNLGSTTLYWATSSSTLYSGSTTSSALAGTWRAMGSTSTTVGASENPVTLFVRVS